MNKTEIEILPEFQNPKEMPEHRIEYWIKKFRTFYANAMVTYKECGGHNKAFHNERACEKWKGKIIEFGGEVPSDKEACAWGFFNGDGSY